MVDDKNTIFREQLSKLPPRVVDFVAESNWDQDLADIGSMYNLNADQLSDFKQEATFVVLGLVHPDEFSEVLAEEAGLHGAVLEAIVAATEQKVFSPVRADLIAFFEKEAETPENEPLVATEYTEEAAPLVPKEPIVVKPSIAPENLPVAPEVESFLPPIPPKKVEAVRMFTQAPEPSVPAPHPFEEKMKQVFTSGQPAKDNLVLEPVPSEMPPTPEPTFVPQTIMPAPTPAEPTQNPSATEIPSQPIIPPIVPKKDPYREPIE